MPNMIKMRFVIDTLTPVHIGSGDAYSPLDVVALSRDPSGLVKCAIVDVERWLSLPDKWPKATPYQNLCKQFAKPGTIAVPDEVIRGYSRAIVRRNQQGSINDLFQCLSRGPGVVAAHQREHDGCLRIPGSSLKGLLMTAWARATKSSRFPPFSDSPGACLRVADVILGTKNSDFIEAHRCYFPSRPDSSHGGGWEKADNKHPCPNAGWKETIPCRTKGIVEVLVDDFRFDALRRRLPAEGAFNLLGCSSFSEALVEALAIHSSSVRQQFAKLATGIERSRPLGFDKDWPIATEGIDDLGYPLPLGFGTYDFSKTANEVNPLGIPTGAQRPTPRHTAILSRQTPSHSDLHDGPEIADPVYMGWVALRVKERQNVLD